MYTYRTGCYDVLILNGMVSQWKNFQGQGHVSTVQYIDIAHCFYVYAFETKTERFWNAETQIFHTVYDAYK